MRLTLSAIALAAAVLSPIAAANAAQTVTVRISYADIDLNTAEGRAALEARVAAEARTACTIEKSVRYDYGRDIVDQKCVNDAREAAIAEAQRIAANETRSGRAAAAN